MRFSRPLVLSALAVLTSATLAMSGCAASPGESSTDGAVKIVASTNVYGQIAEQIGGDRVSVTSIIGTGAQDPHSYEATARDQLAIQRAQLVIENGGGFDHFIDSLLDAAPNDPIVITAVEFNPAWPSDADEHAEDHGEGDDHSDENDAAHEDGDDHGHEHIEGFNEHVWYDPATMIALSAQLATDLTTLDPEGADEFKANAAEFATELAAVEAGLADIKAQHGGEGAFLTEPIVGYLVTAAGLVDVAPAGFAEAVEEGRDVSPSVLLAALRVIEAGDARVVLVNGQTAGAETKRIVDAANDAGTPVLAFTETLPEDASGATTSYAEWMSDNVERLAAALGA